MMNGSIAKRYAIALYEEAKEQFVDQQIYDHLGVLYQSMKAEQELQIALINPRVSIEKKYTLLLLASGLDPEASTLYTSSSIGSCTESSMASTVWCSRQQWKSMTKPSAT